MSKKYGDIPRDIVKTLADRWQKGKLKESGWPDCESWVKWAYANGYQKSYHLGKFDDTKPHGPDNSFFYNLVKKLPEGEEREAGCEFCQDCKNICPGHGNGCSAWREWFVRNWNENICRKPKRRAKLKIEPERNRQFFRYEHPDLDREGIVWTGT